MKSYSFDVLMSAALTVPDMPDEETARATLADCIDCAGANFGLWPNGDPILGEASLAADMVNPRLYAVDGDEIDPGSYFRPIGRHRAPLDSRELGTVLAALSYWQRNHMVIEADDLHEIASNGGTTEPLTEDEIDALCERLNVSPDPLAVPCGGAPHVLINIDGGVVQSVDFEGRACSVEIRDFDTEGSDPEDLPKDDNGQPFYRSEYAHRGDPLYIPAAADLRKSRLADAGEDMLAALECAEEFLSNDPRNNPGDGTLGVIRDAIAKAKGEEIDRPDYEAIARGAGFKVESCADDESRFYAWRFKAGGYKETTYDEATPEAAWKSACESFGLLAV